jgi:hypothetical protein
LREQDEGGEFSYPQSGCSDADAAGATVPKQDRNAGHAFVQNVRREHYELAVEEPVTLRLAVAFDELGLVI